MAGNCEGALYYVNSDPLEHPKGRMGLKLTRAYAEGRQAKADGAAQNTNPHTSGSPAYLSWDVGWTNKDTPVANTQFETAVA